ncbi:hypothetical protein J5N97_028482 [Dioscorea zingiberensis]|uniref:BHLH domain-containing protein n=1 Tax=Dioscorea zingiberensis TaxID=325984 RepID=A0A9D5H4W6_9LILI|nr:hypothetical protein J5N97_028482 [Dioscorea zingiberensis]
MGVDGDPHFMLETREVQLDSGMIAANVDEQHFLASAWDPILSMDHTMSFNDSAAFSSYIPGVSDFHNGGNEQQMTLSLSFFGSKNQVSSHPCPAEFPLGDDNHNEKNLKGKKRKGESEFSASHSDPPLDEFHKVGSEHKKKNGSPDSTKSSKEKDEKKAKTSKHGKEENTQNADTSKDDYIHVRAKRGQATNSHSLAERVRREKISERMRLLQDLVPGCNKITGKAMMLDEIINYVQSLQKQVEFLSMKLAAVNPEMNFDIEQILSKEILHHPQDGNVATLGFSLGMNTPHSHLHGVIQADVGMCSMPNSEGILRLSTSQISPMTRIPSVWDHELQNVVPMSFIHNLPIDSENLNGDMKVEM